MLNADEARVWLEHHFDTVTDEEFVTTVKRVSPDLAQELWGDKTVAQILSRPRNPIRGGFRRLGVDAASMARRNLPAPRGMRGFFTAFGRSVQRLFS